MVAAFIAWPGLVCMLYLIVSVGIRRLPRTRTSSIICCCPWDRSGVATRNVQRRIRKGIAFLEEAPVKKAAIAVSLTVWERKRFSRPLRCAGHTGVQEKKFRLRDLFKCGFCHAPGRKSAKIDGHVIQAHPC